MPRASRIALSPPGTGKETPGQRITGIRKERGVTQVERVERIGLIQTLVCHYENDGLRLSVEMAVRFAMALEIAVDQRLRSASAQTFGKQPSRKVLRRTEKIETLPPTQQSVLLKTINVFLENGALKSAPRLRLLAATKDKNYGQTVRSSVA